MHKGSLRNKFFIRFLIIGLLPIFVLAVAGATILFYARKTAIADLEQKLLAQKESEIERFIKEETIGAMRIILGYETDAVIDFGYDPMQKRYVPERDVQTFLLDGLLADNDALAEVSIINALEFSGGLPPRRGAELKRASRFVEVPADCIPPYHEATGGLPCEFLLNYSQTPLFEKAAGGKDYIGPVYWTLEGPMVTLATPMINKVGTVVAVLRGELRLASLQKSFTSAALGQSGYAFLVDSEGRVVAHSPGSLSIQQDMDASQIVADALLGKRRTGLDAEDTYINSFGKAVIGASLPLRGVGLGLIAEWPYEDAFAELYNLLNQIFLIVFLVSVAIIVFGVAVALQITQPILALRLGAARFGKGELDHPIHLVTNDEIEDLADTLNKMAIDLKKLEQLREVEIRAESLARALEKEKELSKTKDVFITTASHQLRTPVSAINWNVELLKGEQISKEALELLDGIANHARFLGDISNDLLNASSFGLGYTVTGMLKPVNMRQSLQEVFEGYQSEIAKKQLVITQNISDPPPFIAGSYGAIRIMMENLVTNAITYTPPKGAITVTIKDNAEGEVVFEIRDTGIGIPEEEQKYVFDAFFRAHNAIEMKNVGTGLGLFIVKNIVRGHGGTVEFASSVGKGTTVTVKFSRVEAPAAKQY